MLRLLVRPRWVAFTLLTVLLSVVFAQLGQWQLRRHEERAAYNEAVQASQRARPVAVGRLVSPGRTPPTRDEWRAVRAAGRYDAGRTLLVRNRTSEGRVGFWVLTPLVTRPGVALLVNRGWVPAGATARTVPDVPAPPPGPVSVTGRLRLSEDGDDPVFRAPPGQVTHVDVARIASRLPYPVYGGYAELAPQRPAPQRPAGQGGVEPVPPPELSAGPHLAYAVQWFLFVGVALVGWWALLRREASDPASARPHVEHRESPGRAGQAGDTGPAGGRAMQNVR